MKKRNTKKAFALEDLTATILVSSFAFASLIGAFSLFEENHEVITKETITQAQVLKIKDEFQGIRKALRFYENNIAFRLPTQEEFEAEFCGYQERCDGKANTSISHIIYTKTGTGRYTLESYLNEEDTECIYQFDSKKGFSSCESEEV